MIEKSIDIVNSLSEKSEPSEVPEGYKSERGFAGRIERVETKQIARSNK